MNNRFLMTIVAFGAVAASPALATGTYSGTVNGYFDNPVKTGSIVALDGSLTALDNSGTAFVLDTVLAPNNDTITWGLSTTGTKPSYSFLNFVGATFSNVAGDTPFLLGTITYLNGTSDLDTLIFGATLHLDLGSGITPKTSTIPILTTANTGISPARDADLIGFSDFPATFNVYEGGFSIANLYGMIVGDPEVTLTGIAVTEGFEDTGYIGEGVPGVPEPAAWAMLLGGFALTGMRLRRRSAPTVAA